MNLDYKKTEKLNIELDHKDLQRFMELRNHIQYPQPHLMSINKHLVYYKQCLHLAQVLELMFTWTDSNQSSTTSDDWNLEISSVLYNLGVIYSQLQSGDTPGDLKQLALNYQKSAGVFDYIMKNYSDGSLVAEANMNLMLAQAQQSFCIKGTESGIKNGNLAKLWMQTCEFYNNCLQLGSVAYSKELKNLIQVRMLDAKAKAYYQQSLYMQSVAQFGSQVALLKEATLTSKQIQALIHYVENSLYKQELVDFDLLLKQTLMQAERDNDKIYMQIEPLFKNIEPLSCVKMVKPLPLGDVEYELLFPDLMPVKVVETISEYDYKKDLMLKEHIENCTLGIQTCKTILKSLYLPASIEILENPIGIPQKVLDSSQNVREKGGYEYVLKSWQHLKTMVTKCSEILENCTASLKNEQNLDDQYRRTIPNWNRSESKALTKNLWKQLDETKINLEKAVESNLGIEKMLGESLELIKMLSLSSKIDTNLEEELSAIIPSTTINQKILNDPTVRTLNSELTKLSNNIKNCEVIMERIQALKKTDDITKAVVENSSKPTPLSISTIIDNQLQRYSQLISQLQQLMSEQQSILHQITATNSKFTSLKSDNQQAKQRQQMLTNLESAGQYFQALVKNLANGTEFYTQCTVTLEELERRCETFCRSRIAEAQQILGQQQSIQQPGHQY